MKGDNMRYINNEVKEKYIDYSISILNRLKAIKKRRQYLHEDYDKIHYGHLGDLIRIDKDLSDILNYL